MRGARLLQETRKMRFDKMRVGRESGNGTFQSVPGTPVTPAFFIRLIAFNDSIEIGLPRRASFMRTRYSRIYGKPCSRPHAPQFPHTRGRLL